MRRILPLLAGLALLSSLGSLSPRSALAHDFIGKPSFPTLTAKEQERLARGKLVLRTERGSEDGSGLITGVIEINASIDEVWKLLLQFELVPQASKAVKEVTRYIDQPGKGGARDVGIRYQVKIAWVNISYYIHHDIYSQQNYLNWTLDPTKEHDIARTDGSYSLWPGAKPGSARFVYITEVDTGRNIPDWIEEELTESSLKRFLVFIKKQAES
jgi:hypothetical protein